MSGHTRPKVVVSKCLGFDHCRYDGQIITSHLVNDLKEHADMIPVCPEVEIGLGVPRRPIRVIDTEEGTRLVQPATGLDHTEKMEALVNEFLEGLEGVDGFILKSKSPSCGVGDVKHYQSMESKRPLRKENGFFGGEVEKRFSHLARENEGRLRNPTIRDHFLTMLYTLARFREARSRGDKNELIRFQTENKLLLMSLSQKEMKELGRIVANQKSSGVDKAWDLYGIHLSKALEKGARYTANINVAQHCFGYFSDRLTKREKEHFLDTLQLYREDRVPLTSVKQLLISWVIRFDVEYLNGQTYFEPYPVELIEGYESNRGRDFWK